MSAPYDPYRTVWRTLPTANPCNDFIVEYFIRCKITLQKQAFKLFFTYHLAIQSVRRYPLPLVCAEQLKILEGFGDFLVEDTCELIKRHYKRGRLATQQQKVQQHGNLVRKLVYLAEKYEISMYSNRKKKPAGTAKRKCNLVIKKESEYYLFLKAVLDLGALHSPVNKYRINQYFFDTRSDRMSNWKILKHKLLQAGLIKTSESGYFDILLTQEGRKAVLKAQGQQTFQNERIKQRPLKDQSNDQIRLKDYLVNIYDKHIPLTASGQCLRLMVTTNEDVMNEQERMQIMESLQTTPLTLIESDTLESAKQSTAQKERVLGEPKLISRIMISELSKDKRESESINVGGESLGIGAFMWSISNVVLDHIIIRVEASNFNMRKAIKLLHAAKLLHCNTMLVWVDYSRCNQSLISQQSEAMLNSFITQCRVEGIRVLKTHYLKQIAQILLLVHQKLNNRLEKYFQKGSFERDDPIYSVGTLPQFKERFEWKNPFCIREINRDIWQCITLDRTESKEMSSRMPTMAALHSHLDQFDSRSQRMEAMKQLFPRNRACLNELIIDLLCGRKG